MTSEADDETRWAEAMSLLERTAGEPAEHRLRRTRRLRLAVVFGAVLVSTVVAVIVFLLVLDPDSLSPQRDPATPQVVLGFVLSGLGLVVMGVVVFRQIAASRRIRGFRTPLYVLSRAQRKALLAQVRGRRAVRPEHLPLARHLAELLLLQRLSIAVQAGLLVSQAGLWIAQPTTWRLWVVAFVALAVLGGTVAVRRYAGAARAFLDAHPPADVRPGEG